MSVDQHSEGSHRARGIHREVDVQVDAGDDNITSPAVEEHSSTVSVAEVGDLLGYEETWGVNCSA